MSCACLGRGFKALKQIVKLHYKLGQAEEMMEAYRYGRLAHQVGMRCGRAWGRSLGALACLLRRAIRNQARVPCLPGVR